MIRFSNLKIKHKLLISTLIPIILLLLIFLFTSINVNKIRMATSQLQETLVPKVETILLIKDTSSSMILDLERYISTAGQESKNSFYRKKEILDRAIEDYKTIIGGEEEQTFLYQFNLYRDTLLETGEDIFTYYNRRHNLTQNLAAQEIKFENFYRLTESQTKNSQFYKLSFYFQELYAEILAMQLDRNINWNSQQTGPREKISQVIKKIRDSLSSFSLSRQDRTFFKERSEKIFGAAMELADLEKKIYYSIDTLQYIENSIIELTDTTLIYQKMTALNKISYSVSIIKRTLIEVVLTIVILIPAFLLISGYIARQINRSIKILRESAHKIASGDLSQTIRRDSNDEIGDLYDDFNTMAAELELSRTNIIQNILSSIPEYVIVFEYETTTIKYANDLFLTSFPFIDSTIKKEAIIGKKLFSVVKVKPNLEKRIQNLITQKAALSKPKTIEIKIENKVFSNTLFTISRTGKKLLGGIIISDITDAKFYQQHLVDNEKLIALGKVASGIAHEINNPLYAILAYAESIEEKENIDEETNDFAERIIDKVMLISSIIKNVSSYSRNLKQNEIIELDLNYVLEESLNIVKYSFNFLEVDVQTYLSPIPKIKAVKSEIHQVFINLLNNAVQAMEGEGILKLSSHYEHGTIFITIADTGCGIETKDSLHIFDLFYTTKQEGTNTGQGLHIAQKILNKYNATIDFQSEPGEGTTFYLTFTVPEE